MMRVSRIRRYPIKGLAGEDLNGVELSAGAGVPLDRGFALSFEDRLIGLSEDPRLARFSAAIDGDGRLTLYRDGVVAAEGRPDRVGGLAGIESALSQHFEGATIGNPRILSTKSTEAADETKPVSLINLTSLEELAPLLGVTPDPRRFRGNLYLEGVTAWQELGWPGAELIIGAARLRVTEPTARCKMINVDPDRAVADVNIPRAMVKALGHAVCGVYAEVVATGRVVLGDTVELA